MSTNSDPRGSDSRPESVRVEVVKAPDGPRFWRRLIEAVPMAIATSVMTTLVLALASPRIAEYVALFRPTCADPRGLVALPVGQVAATGPSQPSEQDWAANNVANGRLADVWVPQLLPPTKRPSGYSDAESLAVVDSAASTLTLSLNQPEDVQLVCAVNGLANNYSIYSNWSRVRTVQAWTDADQSAVQSTLRTMEQGSFQDFQDIQVPHGDASVVMIQVVDLYEGQQITSVDPDVCGTREEVGEGNRNDPIGCNLNAAPQGGFAEVRVYVQREPRWKALFHL